MKIKYLGTAGSEGVPSIFCACENCAKARALGGRNIRTRSQAIIDDTLLIDFPCDTFYHILNNNIDMFGISACLITHIHPDHMYPMDMRPDKNYGRVLNVYGNGAVGNRIDVIPAEYHKYINFNAVLPFVPFTIEGGYIVTALKANHKTENPYVYAISGNGKNILYLHDSGVLPDESWDYIKNTGVCFDLISLDCHWGDEEDKTVGGHGCLGVAKKLRERFIAEGMANNDTVFILNHFSHKGENSVYDDFSLIAETSGFVVAYDSMEVTI